MRSDKPDGPAGYFPATLWSTILRSKGGDEAALNRLLERYYRPILLEFKSQIRSYAQISPQDSDDLAHEFIQKWLRSKFLKSVSQERGRFRTFVKVCIRRFLIDWSRKAKTPETDPIGPECESEEPYVDPPAPEKEQWSTLDWEWIRPLLAGAMERLERECTENGKKEKAYFDSLRARLTDDLDDNSYARIAAELGVSEGAVRVAHHRLRKRLLEALKQEVRDTVDSEEDFEREWKAICEIAKGQWQ